MTSARFVGRAAELAELQAALRDAAERRPSLALVGGESGVGKSRLADELKRHARESGARVLSGDCVELGDDELPYAPLLSALRPLVREGDPVLDALAPPLRAALDDILPGLGMAGKPGDATQSRVFEALLSLFESLGEGEPVLLVVEDLHWADSSTRSFIGFLARTICTERMLVLGTYRSDELHRRHPLRPLLAELASDPYARLLELSRFTPEELGEQLEGILADRPDPELVERLYSRSEGNALYAEEILAAGLDGRGSLPPTLRDALMLRVERLSPRPQELLRWIACQPSADHELVEEVAGLEPAELRAALREAVASQIVVTVGDDSYAFRHALLREVVYDDLLPGERTELHSALALALEERIERGEGGAHITAQAAHHWAAAGDQPQALRAAVRAALAAERVNAFAEAQALFERALGLWERVDDPERLAGLGEVELLWRSATAADQAGDPARQEALLRRALAQVDEGSDPGRAALIRERLSQSLWSQHRQDESLDALKAALELLPADPPSPERAKLLAQLSRRRMLQSRFAEAAEVAHEAIEVARAAGHREAEAIALNSLGTALGDRGEVDAGVGYLRESLAIAREEGLEMEAGGAWINIADVLHLAGRTEEALETARTGLESAYTRDWRTTDWLRLATSEYSFHLGDWDTAETAIPAASRRHTGGTLLLWETCRAQLALGRGDSEAAERSIAVLRRATADLVEPQFVGSTAALYAELLVRRGDVDEARAAIDDAIDRIEFCSEDVPRMALLAAVGVRVEGDAGERARDRGDEEAAQQARERAYALLERARATAESGWRTEAAQLASAEAEHARATRTPAAALWAAAAETWEGVARAYQVTYARWREAEALMAERDRDGAARAASTALAGARRLGSAWLVEEIESLAARARLNLGEDAAEAASVASPDEPDDPFGLTARERDVLALVAAGATNREIGERLHMAEKTASVHVSRILAKLGVRSRTEAAAVAHRQGLVPSTP
ncbi:MAG TPA: AAA family ATPase [Thermoleophilaceae bacterium]|nr:AAA family ATPase [Thermoleophilaceae bacterium]